MRPRSSRLLVGSWRKQVGQRIVGADARCDERQCPVVPGGGVMNKAAPPETASPVATVGVRPPGPRGIGIRQLRAIRRDPLAYFTSIPGRYGGLARMRLGPIRYFTVAEPALIERVLVDDAHGYRKGLVLERARVLLGDGLLTSEGELHRRQARLAARAFTPTRITSYQDTMRRLAEAASDRWHDGAEMNVAAEMTRLTLQIVVSTLFGTGIDADEADRVGQALTDVLAEFDWLVSHPLGRLRARIPTPRVRRFDAARTVIDGTVARLVAARGADAQGGSDLLAALIAARDDDGHAMTSALLRDEVVTLLIAGHETTANWLSFAWLVLAEHPAVEALLHAELAAQLAARPVTLDDAPRLPYLRAVLEETLRLYPPAWGIGRRAVSDRELGGYAVPAGAVMSMCQFAMHRDPRFWDEPLRFAPDRWLAGSSAARGAFFPFADGPRKCIGEHFARAEALTVMATMCRRWQLRRVAEGPVKLDANVTLRPRGGITMRVTRRAE
jgi:cytochrome P450